MHDDDYQGGAFCTRCGAWRGELGSEPTIELYVEHIVAVFRAVRRVLRPDGTLWLNISDSYSGSGKGGNAGPNSMLRQNREPDQAKHIQPIVRQGFQDDGKVPAGTKPKDLCLIPFRLALALQADGWWVRSDISWCKRAPMPESVTDRPTSAWEHVFLLSKSARYYYDADAVREEQADWERGATGTRIALLDERPEDGVRNRTLNEIDRNGNQRAYNPLGRNQWNYWLLGPEPFPEAHFATFPTEIPRRAILAGSSERGCCPACGAPWRRVVARTSMVTRHSEYREEVGGAKLYAGRTATSGTMLEAPTTTTLGWEPGCACQRRDDVRGQANGASGRDNDGDGLHELPAAANEALDPVPCTILDPFAGSGTTLLVADRLGRRAIGIELSADYAAMARRRIVGDAPLFNTVF